MINVKILDISLRRMPFANFAGGQIYEVSLDDGEDNVFPKRLVASSQSTSRLLPLWFWASSTSWSSRRASSQDLQQRGRTRRRRRRSVAIPLFDFGGRLEENISL